MRKYQIESVLRSPVEIHSALMFAIFAFLFGYYPSYFFLHKGYKLALVSIFIFISLLRTYQASVLFVYKRRLLKNKIWKVSISDIPVNKDTIIGMGFEWKVEHTSRLAYCRTEQGSYHLGKRSQSDSIGGSPEIHGVGIVGYRSEKEYSLTNDSLMGHSLTIGTNGTGKSSNLKFWVAQDIKRGDCTIVIDPKSDSGILDVIYEACAISGRLGDLYILSLANSDLSDSYNPISRFERITEVANRLTNNLNNSDFKEFSWSYINTVVCAIVDIGEDPEYDKILSYSRNFEKMAIDHLSWHLKNEYKIQLENNYQCKLDEAELNDDADEIIKPSEYEHIDKFNSAYKLMLNNEDLKSGISKNLKTQSDEIIALVQLYKKLNSIHSNIESTVRLLDTGKEHLTKLIQNIFPILERVCTGNIKNILTNYSVNGRVFDLETVIKEKKIVYVALDALVDPEVSKLISSSLLADLTTLAGKIYNDGLIDPKIVKNIVRIYGDELRDITGNELKQLLNKCRGANYFFNGFMQSKSDIEDALGDKTGADVILENFNNTYMYRVKNEDTADYLTGTLEEVTIYQQTLITGANDNSDPDSSVDFTSTSEIRSVPKNVPLISNADVMKLPRGHCFGSIAGGKIMKLKFPLIKINRKITPEKFTDKVRNIRREYRRAYA